jgi:predicted DNA binding protein
MSSKMVSEEVTVLPDGWQVKQLFAGRDEFDKIRDFARNMDISFHLDRLYESTSTDADLIGLTDKQREALLAAYEEGYFAVPRQASMAAVAAELDISPSALTERLHRAQAHLIEHFVYADGYKTPADLDTD